MIFIFLCFFVFDPDVGTLVSAVGISSPERQTAVLLQAQAIKCLPQLHHLRKTAEER
jgi:hypothetical protein